jgi:hypothetical protein
MMFHHESTEQKRHTEIEVGARWMASPDGCDPTPDVGQRCEVDDEPPEPSICSLALEQPVVQSQEAVFDRPDYRKE